MSLVRAKGRGQRAEVKGRGKRGEGKGEREENGRSGGLPPVRGFDECGVGGALARHLGSRGLFRLRIPRHRSHLAVL